MGESSAKAAASAENERVHRMADGASRNKCVLVNNLSYTTTEEELREAFSGCADVVINRRNGKSTGVAFVQFNSFEEAGKAIKEKNKTEVGGRVIRVDSLKNKQSDRREEERGGEKEKEKEKRETESCKRPLTENETGRKRRKEYEKAAGRFADREEQDVRTVFITNLTHKDTEEDLKGLFSAYGEVEQCTLVADKNTGESTGKAFVLFQSSDACKKALKDEIILKRRVLAVLKYVSPDVLKKRQTTQEEKDESRKKKIKEKRINRRTGMEQSDEEVIEKSDCRVFLSRIKKSHNRKTISRLIETICEQNGTKVKFRGVNLASDQNKRNPGYCFVTFKHPEHAAFFLDIFDEKIREAAGGPKTFAEYASESKEFVERGFKRRKVRESRKRKAPGAGKAKE